MRLIRLKAGSYETPCGTHFTYRYKPEDGSAPYWPTYRSLSHGGDCIHLGSFQTLKDAREAISRDRQAMMNESLR